MKQLTNTCIQTILTPVYRFQLKSYTGTYYISPLPEYISQFISMYPSSITPKTPLTDESDMKAFGAVDATEFTFWAWRDCAIACVKMILNTRQKATNKTMMDLTHEGLALNGYTLHDKHGTFVDRGWFHRPLICLLDTYHIQASMRKWQTIESVAQDILHNRLVMVSVHVPGRFYIKEDGSFDAKENAVYSGHLFLAIGVKMHNKQIDGIYVHDPRGMEQYQANTFVPASTFNHIFKNRTIVVG